MRGPRGKELLTQFPYARSSWKHHSVIREVLVSSRVKCGVKLDNEDSLVTCGFTRLLLVPVGSPCAFAFPFPRLMASRMEVARGRVRKARQQIATAGGSGSRLPEPLDSAALGLVSKASAASLAVPHAGSSSQPVPAAASEGGLTVYGRRELDSRAGFAPRSGPDFDMIKGVPRASLLDGSARLREEWSQTRVSPQAGMPKPARDFTLPTASLGTTPSRTLVPTSSCTLGSTLQLPGLRRFHQLLACICNFG